MMTQYAYLQTNKLSGDKDFLFSCNVLYTMTQYVYLQNNTSECEIKILFSCNLLLPKYVDTLKYLL